MEKYSLTKTAVLHLFPGLLILGIYVIITPVINGFGYPSLMSLMIAFLLVIIPFEIGYLFLEWKRKGAKESFFKSMLINEAVPRKTFVAVLSAGIITSLVLAGGMSMVDQSIKSALFDWLPDWYFYDQELLNGYSRRAIVITAVARVFVDGFSIPLAEEWYFRGYLLHRIEGKRWQVPLLASMLFAVYHFWQPWNYGTLFAISLILVWPAWYYKNYKMSLYIHLALNLSGSLLFLLMVLNQ